jgi:hypothetical protein
VANHAYNRTPSHAIADSTARTTSFMDVIH